MTATRRRSNASILGRARIWALSTMLAAGCSDVTGPNLYDSDVRSYIEEALDLIEINSVRRFEIDWAAFRAAAHEDAHDATTIPEAYAAIRHALSRLGDNHSFFQPPGEGPAHDETMTEPVVELLGSGVGYLEVPAYSAGGAEGDRYATLYHRLIEKVDAAGACGWVVDLRANTGGNLWPMLAAVGPILGPGLVGSFVYPDASTREWRYTDGAAELDDLTVARADPFYSPRDSFGPVAVLTDSRTASAGEGIAVAFRGRASTRSFGLPTHGVSTGNAGFMLPDGAAIFLTVATMADRLGQRYGGPLPPDVPVANASKSRRAPDPAVQEALSWLEAAHGCPQR